MLQTQQLNPEANSGSGISKNDHLGRTIGTTIDVLIAGEPIEKLNTALSSTTASSATYDYDNRVITSTQVIESGGTQTTTSSYLWDSDGIYYEDWITHFSQGSNTHGRSYKDSWGRVIKSEQVYNGVNQGGLSYTDLLTTTFEYNPLGELLKSINPLQVETSYKYDLAGRMYEEVHQDRGISKMEYDPAGNVIRIQNAALDHTEFIEMEYDFNRLVRKTLPHTDALYGVSFNYGALGDGKNGAGRIVSIEQGDNFKTDSLKYDELGNVVYERSILTLPENGGVIEYDYTTKYAYDSWGRILNMEYPDQEFVEYLYMPTGELYRLHSKLAGESVFGLIIDSLKYDGFGNVSFMKYGNGAITNFTYNEYTRRLEHLVLNTNISVGPTTRGDILDKEYTYDPLGRVQQVENSVLQSVTNQTQMGGNYTMTYGYDAFNRLATTSGTFDDASPQKNYTLAMQYNAAGGITVKDQTASNMDPKLSYNFDYTYNTTNVHQLEEIKNNTSVNGLPEYMGFAYNASGSLRAVSRKGFNQTAHDTIERFVRNEEQLLMGYANYDANTYVHFVYDHKGERILKGSLTTANLAHNGQGGPLSLSMDAYTHYVNPYFVAEHYNTVSKTSKHYYMGAQRVATNLGSFVPPISDPADPTPGLNKSSGTHPIINNLTDILTAFRLEETHEYTAEALLTRADFATYHGTADSAQAHKAEGINNTVPAVRLTYWYHPDYLGHVEYITDRDGLPYQYFWYSPWGETLHEQKASSPNGWGTPYKFNGKELDEETGLYYYGARYYNPMVSVWLGVDPLAHKSPNQTPYHFVSNNPIMRIDPDGRKDIVFNDDGTYKETTNDNFWHNLWYGSRGVLLDSEGKTRRTFSFADPENDVADIQSGVITQIVEVSEQQINEMLQSAGAFDEKNREKPADFLLRESQHKGRFDFSYSEIPDKFPGASKDPLNSPSPMIFLVDDMAHNHMNFGNFLWGAGGAALGVHLGALRIGAHHFSAYVPETRSYRPQFDSIDDQRSIRAGYYYGRGGGLMNRTFGNSRAWDRR